MAIIIFVNVLGCLTARLSSYDLLPNQNLQGIIKIECFRHLLPNENFYPLALGGRLLNSIAYESSFTFSLDVKPIRSNYFVDSGGVL